MRPIVTAIFIIVLLMACQQGAKPFSPNPQLLSLSTLLVKEDSLKGVYTGDFDGSPISIVLHFVSGRHVSGYDMHKGLRRNISGTMAVTGSQLQLDLNEPGTNPYDGSLKIFMDTSLRNIKGWWKSLADKNKLVHFTLTKRVVDKDGYNWTVLDRMQNSFVFKQDGSCTYSYLTGDSTTAQEFTINGNYTIRQDSLLTIYWEVNTVFPSRKSNFTIQFSHQSIDEDGRKLRSITLDDGRAFNELYD